MSRMETLLMDRDLVELGFGLHAPQGTTRIKGTRLTVSVRVWFAADPPRSTSSVGPKTAQK
jgi:hypothetical protein